MTPHDSADHDDRGWSPPIVHDRPDFTRPDGFKRLFAQQRIAGTFARLDAAKIFARGTRRSLRLVPEPDNEHDENAIAVVGDCWHGRTHKTGLRLGYVPSEAAADIAGLDIAAEDIVAHLVEVWWVNNDGRDTIYVRFSMSVPSSVRVPRGRASADRPPARTPAAEREDPPAAGEPSPAPPPAPRPPGLLVRLARFWSSLPPTTRTYAILAAALAAVVGLLLRWVLAATA